MAEADLLRTLHSYDLAFPSLQEAARAGPARTMELLRAASYQNPEWFDDPVLAFCVGRVDDAPADVFWILHNVAAGDAARARPVMDLYARHFERRPDEAIDALYYVATNNPQLLRQDLVDLACAGLAGNAGRAFQTFQYVLAKRPELITTRVVDAVVRNLGAQANQAFYFVREVLKARPEFTPLCTLALFECVFLAEQAWLRQEMLSDIVAIASRSHVRTGLEEALRRPADHGSRAARILMALLFRQSSRALQRVLFESLGNAAAWDPVWAFLRFLIDASDPKQVSTAAVEKFLEGSYRLSQIVDRGEFGELLVRKLDLADAPPAPFPADAGFLNEDAPLVALHRKAGFLARQFGATLRLAPLEQFLARSALTEREHRALSGANTTRRRRRRESLEARLETWKRGETGPRERRALAKKVADALRVQAAEIAQRAIDAAAKDAYRAAIRHVLGRELDVDRVEPGVLPAFLYYGRLGRRPNNRKYLARLIEDRIEGRPHDWMRSEPPAAAWAERVKAGQPGVKLDRWRAEFRKEFAYRPEAALREKQRRIEQDLEQTRALFQELKIEHLEKAGYAALRDKFLEIRGTAKDPAVAEEIANNLERLRIALQQEDASDYEGRLAFEVETDPFRVLFMGEYGFASCLSLRGSNVWSAVSNAIDVDKAVLWARDPAGNIVGRRLVALTPQGVVSYRTYTNRHGLSLDGLFEKFIAAYAEHCGCALARHVASGPLLSDDWYDDGSI